MSDTFDHESDAYYCVKCLEEETEFNQNPSFLNPQDILKENEINIEECEAYWQRMRDEGFWIDGIGWTEKAVKEWNK